MATITRVLAGEQASIDDVNQLIDLLEGTSGYALNFLLRCLAATDFKIRLVDNAGARSFIVQDSDGVTVASINSNGDLTITGAFTPASLIIPGATSPSPTVNGQIIVDSDSSDGSFVIRINGVNYTYTSTTLDTWEHIDTQTLTGTAASVSFQSINSAYTAFRLTAYIENDGNAKSVYIRLNNDSGGNYDYVYVEGEGALGTAAAAAQAEFSMWPTTTLAASESGLIEALIMKPTTAQEAHAHIRATVLGGATVPSVFVTSGTWQNVADLISRIDVVAATNNFAANTRVILEGSKRTT
jgi:hypothetical protein